MSLTAKRNLWILIGILLIVIIKIEIIIPGINILLAIGCFYKAYKVNVLLKSKDNKST